MYIHFFAYLKDVAAWHELSPGTMQVLHVTPSLHIVVRGRWSNQAAGFHQPPPQLSLHAAGLTDMPRDKKVARLFGQPSYPHYLCTDLNKYTLRRDGRVVDYNGLENRRTERYRGFESLSLRSQFL